MLTTDVQPGSNIVLIDFSGALDHDELTACRTTLQGVIDDHGSLRLLARYGDIEMSHIEPKAFFEDLKNIPLIRHIDKCAIVAHQKWIRTISDVAGKVLPCELKTYDLDEDALARTWLQS